MTNPAVENYHLLLPVLPVLLELVRGPERLPAGEQSQETLRAKLRILQAGGDEVEALFAVNTRTHAHPTLATRRRRLPTPVVVGAVRSPRLHQQ